MFVRQQMKAPLLYQLWRLYSVALTVFLFLVAALENSLVLAGFGVVMFLITLRSLRP